MEKLKYNKYNLSVYHAKPCCTIHGPIMLTLTNSHGDNLLFTEHNDIC